MTVSDIIVLTAAAVLLAGLGWFFFGPRRRKSENVAELERGVQRVLVTVRGGYSPDSIRVREGIPVELVFDRRESGACSSPVADGGTK